MGKSNYPNKLDTSIEIPAVRDNIVEVGSDVLNSLRSAIFNIERTLGVNPQGATGNTVASRVNRALDGNGNILKEALDKAGLVSGPITDADVSKTAGIDESKLKLEYPTTLLQDEISQLIQQIENISTTLEELSYLYAAHTHYEAKNRHKGNAIAIDAIDRVLSSTGMVSSERQTAQELFEAIFSSHINYDGSDISESNRSHEASQLFFDKTDVAAHVTSEDVQGAIIDVLRAMLGQVTDHQNRHHSNGALRTSIITGAEDISAGRMLLDEQEVVYSSYDWMSETTKLSTVTFPDEPLVPSESIERSDILRLYSEVDEESLDYQIHSIGYSNEGTTILFVKIFGALGRNSLPTDRAKIFRNKNARTSPASLLASARLYPAPGPLVDTNIDLIQIANPSSSTIISKGIRPSEISINNRYMNIVIDGDEENNIKLDVHDGMAPSGQTIDSIINKMNIKFAKEAASVLAYRVDYDDLHSPEIALVHSLPSTLTQPFTLSVSRSQDDGIDSLGFGHVEDEVIDQGSGSEYYIQGEKYSNLGIKLEQTGLTLMGGTSNVQSIVAGINFEDYEVMVGDLLVITNTADDDGTYVITNVQSQMLEVDSDQLSGGTWDGGASQEAVFYILKSTVSLSEFEFYKPIGGVGKGAVVDIFLNKDREIFYNTRLEYEIKTYIASNSLISPCDFDGDVSLYEKDSEGIITASLTAGGALRLSLDGGIPVEASGLKSKYINLKSGLHNITIKAFIEDADQIKNKIVNEGDFSIELHGDSDINLEENLLIARVLYDSKNSRITGAGPGSDGLLPRIFKKLESGITSDKDLSSKALKRVYQGPISETRSNGVTEGLKLTPAAEPMLAAAPNEYVVNISGGACYVKGKKFVFDKYTDLISDIGAEDFDKVFIAINEWGEIVFAGAGGAGGADCACPFSADSYCILAVIEWDGLNTPVAIDLRLFLNDLDLKVLNAVTVSPQQGMGHFTEFGEALKYAKRFGDMFPNAGIPTVHLKSGTHKVVVNTGVQLAAYTTEDHYQAASYYGSWINFPVNITGEGHSTVLDIMKTYSDAGEEEDDRTGPVGFHAGYLFIAGPGLKASKPDGTGPGLNNGFITLSNLRLKDCSIYLIDPWTKDLDGNKLNWGVKIDGVTFDRSDKIDFSPYSAGVRIKNQDSDGTESIGNLSISNCQFLNAGALYSNSGAPTWPSDAYRNISFLNNTFRGSGDGEHDGETNWIAYIVDGSIFNLGGAPARNNIEYRGNIIADSENSYTGVAGEVLPHVDRLDLHYWGDRISRDLSVGGFVGIGINAAHGIGSPQLYVSNDLSGADKSLWVDGNSRIGGELLIDGSIEMGDSFLRLGNGNIQLINGYILLTNGDIELTHGDINLINGSLSANDLRLEDSEAKIEIISTSNISTDGAVIHFMRNTPTIWAGDRLGEIWFQGKEDDTSGDYKIGAAILAEADGNWTAGNYPGNLIFRTTETNSSTEKMRLAPDGTLRVHAGSGVTLGGPSGRLQVGGNSSGTGAHIAIDGDDIQSKDTGTTAGSLHMNRLGGDVYIGAYNKVRLGYHELTEFEVLSALTEIHSETIDLGANGSHSLRIAPNSAYAHGASIQSFANHGSVGWPLHLQPDESHVEIGAADREAHGALVVKNTDTSTSGLYTTIRALNYKTNGQSCTLELQFPEMTVDDAENFGYGSGDPFSNDGLVFIDFRVGGAGGANLGHISSDDSGGLVFEDNFTGSHPSVIKKDQEVFAGMIMSSTGEIWTKSTTSLSSGIPKLKASSEKNDPKVYGVLRIIGRSADQTYEGITKINGVLEDEQRVVVNSVGEGRILVTNYNGNVLNGDYVTSSDIKGYGMKQDDGILHNYTVAKCVEDIDWNTVVNEVEYNGVKYKAHLACCTYHCG